MAILLVAVLTTGAEATVAVARAHHRSAHHKRRRRTRHTHCYTRRHHRRHRVRCATRKTKVSSAHGNGISPSPAAPGSAPSSGTTSSGTTSNNWSGYDQGTLEQGGTLFHSVGAQWTVPTATQHTSGQAESSSDWIGIGGGCVDAGCTVTDPTLIQTGTEQDVSAGGQASYSAWWEVIPGPSLTITSMAVHDGDRMSASIAELVPDSNVWTITISDLTDGQSYSTTVPYTSTHATAEWIQETPVEIGTDAGFAAQPNLATPAFDLATVNGAPANLKPSEEMQLVDSSGNPIATPSSPDPDADGFNVCAWASTCSAPTSS